MRINSIQLKFLEAFAFAAFEFSADADGGEVYDEKETE